MSLSDNRFGSDPLYDEMFGEVESYYASGAAERDARMMRAPGGSEERILSPEEVTRAKEAGAQFVALMRKVRSTMRSRDQVYYEMGLRAAHLEEALAHGEIDRAYAHYQRLLEIASMLRRGG